jgi:hypothetical protein
VQRFANQAMGISTTTIEGSPLQSQANEIAVSHGKEPDLA